MSDYKHFYLICTLEGKRYTVSANTGSVKTAVECINLPIRWIKRATIMSNSTGQCPPITRKEIDNMASTYEIQRATARFGKMLEQRGWHIFGYSEEQSKDSAGNWRPASWAGIATHPDYPGVMVCVDMSKYNIDQAVSQKWPIPGNITPKGKGWHIEKDGHLLQAEVGWFNRAGAHSNWHKYVTKGVDLIEAAARAAHRRGDDEPGLLSKELGLVVIRHDETLGTKTQVYFPDKPSAATRRPIKSPPFRMWFDRSLMAWVSHEKLDHLDLMCAINRYEETYEQHVENPPVEDPPKKVEHFSVTQGKEPVVQEKVLAPWTLDRAGWKLYQAKLRNPQYPIMDAADGDYHRIEVAKALDRGETIFPEIKNDYPDMFTPLAPKFELHDYVKTYLGIGKVIQVGDYDDYAKTNRYHVENIDPHKRQWMNEHNLEPAERPAKKEWPPKLADGELDYDLMIEQFDELLSTSNNEGKHSGGNSIAYDYIPDWAAPFVPALYSQEHSENPIAWIKFFHPASSWSWFLTEYDPENKLAFGLVIGQSTEFGYFSMTELEELEVRGLKIEREVWTKPTPVKFLAEYQEEWGTNGPYPGHVPPEKVKGSKSSTPVDISTDIPVDIKPDISDLLDKTHHELTQAQYLQVIARQEGRETTFEDKLGHRQAIVDAITEGKEIPLAVLQPDYDDLVQVLTFDDTIEGKVIFANESYLILAPILERDGTKYSTGWTLYYITESGDPNVIEIAENQCLADWSLKETIALAQKYLQTVFVLEGEYNGPDQFPKSADVLDKKYRDDDPPPSSTDNYDIVAGDPAIETDPPVETTEADLLQTVLTTGELWLHDTWETAIRSSLVTGDCGIDKLPDGYEMFGYDGRTKYTRSIPSGLNKFAEQLLAKKEQTPVEEPTPLTEESVEQIIEEEKASLAKAGLVALSVDELLKSEEPFVKEHIVVCKMESIPENIDTSEEVSTPEPVIDTCEGTDCDEPITNETPCGEKLCNNCFENHMQGGCGLPDCAIEEDDEEPEITPEAEAEYDEWDLHLLTGHVAKKRSAFWTALKAIQHADTLRLALQNVNGDVKRRKAIEGQLALLTQEPA